ncbi:trypsin-like peptidase domain-containing protein [Rhodococcus sp. IEGM 1379]|uniref:S1C family serine protease n=1 Tax=Rhodococcus sp. IEGM 1379 TaxID=3047086 RepID=UPI0024B6C408|nr:trypsin-like peptidase domain-containing protein [Rhodococcus sp. IEGM 1379]MDI9915691.1 trypsin-like peptidase domain-containing protein [Rhodococcus sp. IEGM 1379]
MDTDSLANGSVDRPADAPVLEPRPVYRPQIDPASRQVFGRPSGVDGSFSPTSVRGVPAPDVVVGSPDPVLAEAFGRPDGESESIGRDPDAESASEPEDERPSDPWRDPASSVALGSPAAQTQPEILPPAPKLDVRDVLFGRKVAPSALAALAGMALVIALVGGLLATVITADRGALTSQRVTLVQSGSGEQPQSQVAKVADAVLPSVVSIQVAVGDQGSTGSGVVIDGAGYIVTNNHVISSAVPPAQNARIRVIFSDGTKTDAQIVGRDVKTDLAVLKVAADNLTVAQLGKSGDVQVGDEVIAVGSPLGLSKTVTSGIVSALNRPLRLSGDGTDTNAVIDAVQTDAAINHGNSGGALVDDEARVIGINTAMLSESGGSVGLGFAIPIDTVTTVAQAIIRDGSVHHPDIGVNARTAVNDATSGAAVANVRDGSPAQRAGIVEGDVIVKVGDRPVTSADELVVAVNATTIGQPVNVQLIREGRQVDISVTPVSD